MGRATTKLNCTCADCWYAARKEQKKKEANPHEGVCPECLFRGIECHGSASHNALCEVSIVLHWDTTLSKTIKRHIK